MDKRYALGLALLLITVCLWVSTSTLIQIIFVNFEYAKPFGLTWYSLSLFSLYLPLNAALRRARHQQPEYASLATERGITASSNSTDNQSSTSPDLRLSWKLCGVLSVSWFLMNYSDNLSLLYTSVSSSTSFTSTSSLVVVLINAAYHRVWPSRLQSFSVAVVILGSALVASADSATPQERPAAETVTGDALALLSSVLYGLYIFLLQLLLVDESSASASGTPDLQRVLGRMGLIGLVTLWPIGLALHLTSIETIQLPTTVPVILSLLIHGFIGTVVSDLVWAYTVFLTSPLVSSFALSLTIPVAMLSQSLIRQTSYTPLYIGGSMVIVVGIVLGSIASSFSIQSIEKDATATEIMLERGLSSSSRRLKQ